MKILLKILFIFNSTLLTGQLFTLSDNYVHESLAINPAYAGSKGALNATLFYRSYLKTFKGSPVTSLLSLHTPLYNERLGLGFLVMSDKIGINNETCISGNYAYRVNLGNGRLAFGLGTSIAIKKTNWNDLAANDIDDEELSHQMTSGMLPDFSLGLYYSTEKYFVGLSAPLFLSHSYDTKSEKYLTENNFREYNYFVNTGYIFHLNKSIVFYPSALIKITSGKTQIEMNGQAILKNRVWIGALYRSSRTFAAQLQVQLNNQLRIGYSRDFVTGKNMGYFNNSHEFIVNYEFNYNIKVVNPRMF